MSDLKYKVGDRFKSKKSCAEIEIIETQGGKNPYVLNGGRVADDEMIDVCFNKLEQSKLVETEYAKREDGFKPNLNIEANKHHLIWKDKQSIDIIKGVLTEEEYQGFLKGNILRYQLRLGKKDGVEKEVRKIKDYTDELNKTL